LLPFDYPADAHFAGTLRPQPFPAVADVRHDYPVLEIQRCGSDFDLAGGDASIYWPASRCFCWCLASRSSSFCFRGSRPFLQFIPQLGSPRKVSTVLGLQRIRIIATQTPFTQRSRRPGCSFIEWVGHGLVLMADQW